MLVTTATLRETVKNYLALGRPVPTEAQFEAFQDLLEHTLKLPENHKASIVAELDEDGALIVSLTEDELTQHAVLSTEGELDGDWF